MPRGNTPNVLNTVITDLTKSRETYTEGSDEDTQLNALKTF